MAVKPKGDAAQAEGAGETRTIEWRGLELALPDDLPGSTLWDYAAIEDGRKQMSPALDLLRSILGADQEDAIKAKVAEEKLTLPETVDEILGDDGLIAQVMGSYGVAPGESEASTPS